MVNQASETGGQPGAQEALPSTTSVPPVQEQDWSKLLAEAPDSIFGHPRIQERLVQERRRQQAESDQGASRALARERQQFQDEIQRRENASLQQRMDAWYANASDEDKAHFMDNMLPLQRMQEEMQTKAQAMATQYVETSAVELSRHLYGQLQAGFAKAAREANLTAQDKARLNQAWKQGPEVGIATAFEVLANKLGDKRGSAKAEAIVKEQLARAGIEMPNASTQAASSPGSRRYTVADLHDMSPEEYNAHRDEIFRQIQSRR